mmetsp:Transcript_56847/g.165019  ORF Transcript_56847/g.165019 Transcript_56847/m.165019 type:complete len:213 (+) Transcript_56847:1494-2132(+)
MPEQLDGGLLGVLQDDTLARGVVHRFGDERGQTLNQLPEHALCPHLCSSANCRQAIEVGLLHHHALSLALLQALEHMLQRAVRRQDLQAILSHTEQPIPVVSDIVVDLERVLVVAERAPPEHNAEQLEVNALKLVDLHVPLWLVGHLARQSVPELDRYAADLLTRKVCALHDDVQDAQDLVIPDLLHDQGHQALARFHIDAADLQKPVLLGI